MRVEYEVSGWKRVRATHVPGGINRCKRGPLKPPLLRGKLLARHRDRSVMYQEYILHINNINVSPHLSNSPLKAVTLANDEIEIIRLGFDVDTPFT